jgi:hypothetical protein
MNHFFYDCSIHRSPGGSQSIYLGFLPSGRYECFRKILRMMYYLRGGLSMSHQELLTVSWCSEWNLRNFKVRQMKRFLEEVTVKLLDNPGRRLAVTSRSHDWSAGCVEISSNKRHLQLPHLDRPSVVMIAQSFHQRKMTRLSLKLSYQNTLLATKKLFPYVKNHAPRHQLRPCTTNSALI